MFLLGGIFYVIFVGLVSQTMPPYDYNKDHEPRVQVQSPAASAPEAKE